MTKIWIDLDNTPHIPFFFPIIKELKKRGHVILLTARDAYQVCELADHFKMEYIRIGHHYGKNKIMKVVGSIIRSLQMFPIALKEKPALAISHGSRSQLITATLLGIPKIMIYDYEYSKGLSGMHPICIMVPEVIPDSVISPHVKYVYKYPGIKEDVYVPDFKPDPSIINTLGVRSECIIVTVRPPATEAHYFTPKSEELFIATIEYLAKKPDTQIILLPRNSKQEIEVRKRWPKLFDSHNIIIPQHAVDGLNLMWNSDFVVSGGGTMNREAAALGVPVYSIFRGEIGAVDRYLVDQGRLVLIEGVDDLEKKLPICTRDKNININVNNITFNFIIEHIENILDINKKYDGYRKKR